jgi:hypothetical protein
MEEGLGGKKKEELRSSKERIIDFFEGGGRVDVHE